MKKKRVILFSIAILLVAGFLWLIWENTTVGITQCTIDEKDLPASFAGYRIAHVSDLHNSRLWKQTIDQLIKAQPDIICITGDIVDCRKTDVQVALDFAAEAVKIAPCYYITGNHEHRLPEEVYDILMDGLAALGVTLLLDRQVILENNGEQIALIGHDCDSSMTTGELSDFAGYRILLSHRPEYFKEYVAAGYELVFSGHAHGGQFRLPLIGGLYAPGQGILPEYDGGVYTDGRTDMIVSRGIGNSGFPIRFNNRPEVILLILECQ